ncbi:protein chibby homolog 1-like [Conger conger]|uniref:protein chibby homolog 1-like n=1 Tax=Conger conger TaxID=82655 RepID=UPI002A5B0486|nr:protein chibby homolog 1-like [Conger conger]
MSMLKAIWDRLGDSVSSLGSSFRSALPLWASSSGASYILDYNSRATALGLDGPPTLSLAGLSFTFTQGRWVLSGPGQPSKSRLRRLAHRKRALQEENNQLKLRVEALMDQLAAATAQLEALRQEGRAGKRPPPKLVTVVSQ